MERVSQARKRHVKTDEERAQDFKLLQMIEQANKRVLTLEEAAVYIGRTRGALYLMIHKSQIPSYKRGRMRYFKREELDNWMLGTRFATVDEIVEDARRKK